MSIGIALLDYNQTDVTVRCMDSILESETHPETVVLVENGTTSIPDHDVERFRQELDLVVLRPGKNLGCAGGRNLGLNYLSSNTDVSKYIILDNDTVLPSDFLELVDQLKIDSLEVYAPIVRGLNHDSLWGGGRLTDSGEPKINRTVPKSDGPGVSVDWAPGACLIFGPDTWDQVGEFDEWMNFYFEDTDWCMRVQQTGGDVIVDPDLHVLHEKHDSLDEKGGMQRTRFWARNGAVFRANSLEMGVPALATWSGKQLRLALDESLNGDLYKSKARVGGLTEGVVESFARR